MHIVLGGTGHVGGAVARSLLTRGEDVLIVSHDETKTAAAEASGFRTAVVDILDVEGLRRVFQRGRRAFLLNPPAAPSTDTDEVETRTANAIIAALEGSGLEKVVAQSTYGVRPGEGCGDLTVLYAFEQALAAQPIPAVIMRAAYLMTNFEPQLETMRKTGVLASFFPADFSLPMVAPRDLGVHAADMLIDPSTTFGLSHVEGPKRYTFDQVAAAFADAWGRPVTVAETRRDKWVRSYRSLGFSNAAAASYACMTAATLDGEFPDVEEVRRGRTSLSDFAAETSSSSA